MRTVYSCQDALELVPTLVSQVVNIQVRGVLYPTWCQIITGSAWALVMKMSGSSTNFGYDSALWSTSAVLNVATGITGGISDTSFYVNSSAATTNRVIVPGGLGNGAGLGTVANASVNTVLTIESSNSGVGSVGGFVTYYVTDYLFGQQNV